MYRRNGCWHAQHSLVAPSRRVEAEAVVSHVLNLILVICVFGLMEATRSSILKWLI